MPSVRTSEELRDIRYYKALKRISRFLQNWIYLLIAACTVLTLIGLDSNNWQYTYTDADGYMRALRIYHWLLNPTFWEQPIPESNYPFGEIIHWTRSMDILWLINILPYTLIGINDLREIIFLGGALLSPWLFVLTAIALVYGLRRRFNIYLCIFGCFILLSDPIIQNYYAIGRPDHHSLMGLLGIYAVSLNLCWLKKRQNRYLRWLGFSLALATFTAIEGLILYALFLSFFVYIYIFKNISLLPAVKTAKYFAICLSLFWFINPPYEGWFYPDNGRLSILFVSFAWFIFLALYGIELGHLHTRALKIWSLICAGLGIALLLLVIFGTNIYHFPLDNEISNVWSSRISEMKPIWKQNIQLILAVYSFSGIALILSFWLVQYKPYQRMMILNLCIGLPLYFLNCVALRFANYQILYSILPWLCLVDMLYRKSAFAQRKSTEFPLKIWEYCLGILLLQQLVFVPYNIAALEKKQKSAFNRRLCQSVSQIGGTLVTDNFLSPQYMWECNVNTIGTPYHRNREGLVDNHTLLQATDDKTIIPLLLKHQVRQILLFDKYDKYYDMSEENKDKLYYRLIKRENIPSYLEEVPDIKANTRHYRVKL